MLRSLVGSEMCIRDSCQREPRPHACMASVSDGILRGPLRSSLIVQRSIEFVQLRDLGIKRVIRVRIVQKRADGEQNLRYRERGTPLIFEDIQADRAVRVDVGMEDPGDELDLWWLKRIVRWEVHSQGEHAPCERAFCWSKDVGIPHKPVSAPWPS
eukprot:TRINITY_DN44406_c0_g1_i1.p1 TRINITY_DN44406_c0_g1~~TRINITY_DN44406_c0_g1_i1.p1  ORF type:complete len:179 (+),score=23.27 TRINITY_DN44406_c0_g1_i1:71-538(+)